jgi:hypothetical protein
MRGSVMLYFAEFFSGLVAKSSKFYQEHSAIQTAHRTTICNFAHLPLLIALAAFPFCASYAEDL